MSCRGRSLRGSLRARHQTSRSWEPRERTPASRVCRRSIRGVAAGRVHLTKTEHAAKWLREQIREGDLFPGQHLRPEDFAEQLGMSPTPIREALRLLQVDQLVDYRPHVGHVVASPVALPEIVRLRTLLEPIATEFAVPRLHDTPELLANLEHLHESYAEAVERGRGETVTERNALWHAAIYQASGWVFLQDFIRRLWDSFPWRTIWALSGHNAKSFRGHALIMTAIRTGDATLAAERMRAHVAGSEQSVVPVAKQHVAPSAARTSRA